MSIVALVRHNGQMGPETKTDQWDSFAANVLFDAYWSSETAFCLVTRSGRVLHSNARCRILWSKGARGLALRDGVIVPRTPQARARLLAALNRSRRSIVIFGDGSEEERVCVALVQPLRSNDHAMLSFWLPERPSLSMFAPIGEYFALSPQQARVAIELISGRTVEQIARKLGVTIDTIRSHLKAIYDKTGARSQAGVVARALRFLRL